MDFGLSFNMDNDDFKWQPEMKASRILKEIADNITEGKVFGNIHDINGNYVGSWEFDLE